MKVSADAGRASPPRSNPKRRDPPPFDGGGHKLTSAPVAEGPQRAGPPPSLPNYPYSGGFSESAHLLSTKFLDSETISSHASILN